jgi:hypothetical protein
VAKVIEPTRAHYEVQEVAYGTVYRWNPETIVVACVCGKRPTLSGLVVACDICGENHSGTAREELGAREILEDKDLHPWRFVEDREDVGIPF